MAEYNKEKIEKIVNKYKLSQKEYDDLLRTVIQVMAVDKIGSSNPLAIIVGGQQGSGKTALINYTSLISSKREFVIIDNDFFRAFHPMAAEIKQLYPSLYTNITDQIGMGFTSSVVSYFMGEDIPLASGGVIKNENHVKFDLIFHQTLKNTRIADDAMAKLRESGYTVGVRAFAVPYFESKMSQMERCQAQYENMGFCRHVPPEGHFASLNGIPGTIEYIEQNNKADFIEIFKRGEDIRAPKLVYAKFNPESKDETLKTLENCENASHEDNTSNFSSARDALEKTWETETKKCSLTLGNRIENFVQSGGADVPGMTIHLEELRENLAKFLNDEQQTCPLDNSN